MKADDLSLNGWRRAILVHRFGWIHNPTPTAILHLFIVHRWGNSSAKFNGSSLIVNCTSFLSKWHLSTEKWPPVIYMVRIDMTCNGQYNGIWRSQTPLRKLKQSAEAMQSAYGSSTGKICTGDCDMVPSITPRKQKFLMHPISIVECTADVVLASEIFVWNGKWYNIHATDGSICSAETL